MSDQDKVYWHSMIRSAGETRSLSLEGRRGTELQIEGLTIFVADGPDKGQKVSSTSGTVRVGTSPENDLVLTDPTVSRTHASLTLQVDGVRVADRDSKNGTWVQDTRIDEAVVPIGGKVRVGSSTLGTAVAGKKFAVFPSEAHSFCGMVSQSDAMRNLFALVQQMARFDLSVLVTGETGCGKELMSRALHDAGPRKNRNYLVFDCGSVVKDLLASELFGHEKGAFTGALTPRAGLFEQADGGTVVLDEVGEIDLALQSNLLRVLESREIVRLGSSKRVPVSFRLVAATNRDLRQMVEEGQFRSDLYYRLSAVNIHIPPLRERRDDIPLLADRFLQACADRHQLAQSPLSTAAITELAGYEWPGNVRELRNVCETLSILTQGKMVEVEQVRQALPMARGAAAKPRSSFESPDPGRVPPRASRRIPYPVHAAMANLERDSLREVLEACGWNCSVAARRLGIGRSTLYEKMSRLGLERPAGPDPDEGPG